VSGITALQTAIKPSVQASLDLRTLVLKLIAQNHEILEGLKLDEIKEQEAA
jgi:hypothetical protein